MCHIINMGLVIPYPFVVPYRLDLNHTMTITHTPWLLLVAKEYYWFPSATIVSNSISLRHACPNIGFKSISVYCFILYHCRYLMHLRCQMSFLNNHSINISHTNSINQNSLRKNKQVRTRDHWVIRHMCNVFWCKVPIVILAVHLMPTSHEDRLYVWADEDTDI